LGSSFTDAEIGKKVGHLSEVVRAARWPDS